MSELNSPGGPSEPISVPRTLLGGVLMGLANLVPGISGGTMILAIGLYDRFVKSLADVTRLRLRLPSLAFLGLLAIGAVVAILGLSGIAVGLVIDHRWVMYSLFVGMTLGGVPDLWRASRPRTPGVLVCSAIGLGLMIFLGLELSSASLPATIPVLILVGAAAASSMILPGVSGSYVLLILGFYETVIGSLSPSAWREDMAGSMGIVLPVVLGAALGIALLSNVLQLFLARFSAQSHGFLLGLLLGSVVGLWPFQEPVHPDMAQREQRKATLMLNAGHSRAEVREKYGEELDDALLDQLEARWAGRSASDLKRAGEELERFHPAGKQIGSAIALLLFGFLLTRVLGRRDPSDQAMS